jgi:hypothetical protein
VINRTLARRLSKLEERFRPALKPMTIVVSYVDSNGEVTSGYEVQVGAKGASGDERRKWSQNRQMSSGVLR